MLWYCCIRGVCLGDFSGAGEDIGSSVTYVYCSGNFESINSRKTRLKIVENQMKKRSPPGDDDLSALVQELAHSLKARGWTLATAESCTGGWIAKCCTDLAGSSAWFERGFVSYSNESKCELLGVDADTLESEGAVSAAVAAQMAEGARRRAGVNAALAVTGIAGPDGGTEDKPVGTVWFGWSLHGQPAKTGMQCFNGDRDAVRRQTVAHALAGMRALSER
jgi:nicotinamide-nucleotide amidase